MAKLIETGKRSARIDCDCGAKHEIVADDEGKLTLTSYAPTKPPEPAPVKKKKPRSIFDPLDTGEEKDENKQ